MSPQAERLLGYPLAEWFETPNAWVKYLHEEDRDWAIQFCVSETEAKRDHRFEYRMVAADGSIRWLQDIVNVVIEDGRAVKLRGVMVDITERKRAEAERERASAEASRFFNLTLDLFCVVGFDGYHKRVNPAFEQTLGYTEQELLSRPVREFIHPDDRGASAAALARAAETEPGTPFVNRYLDRAGNTHWIEWVGRSVPEERLVYGAGRDITVRRRYAEEQAALRRLATLVAAGSTPEMVFEAVVSEAAAMLDTIHVVLLRYEQDRRARVLAASTVSGGPTAGMRIALDGESVTSRVLATGRTARMDGYGAARGAIAEYVRGLSGADTVSIGAPIVVDGNLWGVLLADWSGATPASADAEQNLRRFTELVGMAIANAQSRSELAASRERLMIAGDEARHRIQRNLHDGAQQRLVSLGLELREARAMVPESDPLSSRLDRMAAILDEASTELQDISRGLHPALLTRGGLRSALGALVDRVGVSVQLSVEVPVELPEPLEVAVYYMVSEALTNIAKHARASTVEVTVTVANGEVALVVRDDGVGGADPAGGSGLTGLRDRAETIGGVLEVTSPHGGGTVLSARLPIDRSRTGPDEWLRGSADSEPDVAAGI